MGSFYFPPISGGGGSVDSVFGRTGHVVALTGDYTAAQVTNAVDQTASYANPTWLTSLAWTKITGAPSFITTLNGLTPATQNFGTGTSGTDFNIASSGSTHTFNIPSASATSRGLLTAADWTNFNSKEPAITPGSVNQYFRGDKVFVDRPICLVVASLSLLGSLTAQTFAATTNGIRIRPIDIPNLITVRRITFNISTAAAGGTAAAGIYDTSGVLLVQTGPQSTSATGLVSVTVSPVTLEPGTYWFATGADNTSAAGSGISISATIASIYNAGTPEFFGSATGYTTLSGLPGTISMTPSGSGAPTVYVAFADN